MTWRDEWLRIFGSEPLDRTSREVSVQDVLTQLIAGRRTAWFERCEPTERGSAFLQALWRRAFDGDPPDRIEWFVSEFALPVPPEWRDEIKLRYGCPDFALGAGDRTLIIELKTEASSYRAGQMADYARLSRRLLPDAAIDLVLLAPSRPGGTPEVDASQRYAELTWADIPPLLHESFGDDEPASPLTEFLELELAPPAADIDPAEVAALARADRIAAAVNHALRMAPAVDHARADDQTERGIDVEFPTDEDARAAHIAIKAALNDAGYDGRVGCWLWKPKSKGVPSTPAGEAMGRELRLEPKTPHPV